MRIQQGKACESSLKWCYANIYLLLSLLSIICFMPLGHYVLVFPVESMSDNSSP